jgi:hypothetical protein
MSAANILMVTEAAMRPTRLLLAAALGLSLLACTQQQPTSSPQDLAYCAKLSQLYQRYVGANPGSSSMSGVTPNVEGGEAVAKCREGDEGVHPHARAPAQGCRHAPSAAQLTRKQRAKGNTRWIEAPGSPRI